MLTTHDRIRELRAELAECRLTRRERAQATAELTGLLARLAAEWNPGVPSPHPPPPG